MGSPKHHFVGLEDRRTNITDYAKEDVFCPSLTRAQESGAKI